MSAQWQTLRAEAERQISTKTNFIPAAQGMSSGNKVRLFDGAVRSMQHVGRRLAWPRLSPFSAKSSRTDHRPRTVIQCRNDRPARYFVQIRSTAGLDRQINESPLSFTFGGVARFARFEGWCIPWCSFVIAAALIRFSSGLCYRLWSWFKCHKSSPLWLKNYRGRITFYLISGQQHCCVTARRVLAEVTLPHFTQDRRCERAGFHVWTEIQSACRRPALAPPLGRKHLFR